MNQSMQRPCGCIDNIWRNQVITDMCQQHVAIANSQGNTQQQGMRSPQMQGPTTIGGIPSHLFAQFQMGGLGHPFQMPQQGVHVRMQPQGAGIG